MELDLPKCSLAGLKTKKYFNFGLIYGKPVPVIEDLRQNVFCFAAKIYLNSVYNAVDQCWRSQRFGAGPTEAALVGCMPAL